jgi:probable F420-dependent oxidoreductase
MRLGFALPQGGPAAGPDAIKTAAQRAEALGYDSVWVLDRLLSPIHPRAKYGGTPDGKLPEYARRVIDPILALTWAAANTQRVRVGSSVLNLAWYSPALLGRNLTSLDILSNGRLTVGFGAGWSPDEYEAAGSDFEKRFGRMSEGLEVLHKLWTQDEPEHKGTYYAFPKSIVAKPAQKGGPPVYLAAFNPKAMKLVAEKTNGWAPSGLPAPAVKQMFAGMQAMASAAGRDPASLGILYRMNVKLTKEPVSGQRPSGVGTADQIRGDIQALREVGVTEMFFDLQLSGDTPPLQEQLEKMDQLWNLAH